MGIFFIPFFLPTGRPVTYFSILPLPLPQDLLILSSFTFFFFSLGALWCDTDTLISFFQNSFAFTFHLFILLEPFLWKWSGDSVPFFFFGMGILLLYYFFFLYFASMDRCMYLLSIGRFMTLLYYYIITTIFFSWMSVLMLDYP